MFCTFLKALGWLNIHPGFNIENQTEKTLRKYKMHKTLCDTLKREIPTPPFAPFVGYRKYENTKT